MTTTTQEDGAPAKEQEHAVLINESSAHGLIAVSNGLRRFVEFVGKWATFLLIPLVLITVFDVTARKIPGFQYWMVQNWGELFQSTLLQELEWHFHTALFALVLGYGYVHNTHVRVDLVREHLGNRKKAWLEFIGCSVFMIPYCLITIWFAVEFAYASWAIGEVSSSMVGLHHRWIIKSILAVGLIVAFLAGLAVWLQSLLVLFAPPHLRFPLMTLEWPEEQGTTHEGVKRISLDDMEADASKVRQNFDFESEVMIKKDKKS